ncbi:SLAP domain-containing protein [Lactobacillus helveticus]|uniref:Cell division protein n=1 Tax=Lactobacillus helveticus TaxID=1587 RepID=A0A8H9KGD0_LACHE|nr:SLAP domain-containing protein [Lactobacillus helveticus]MBW8061625.1 cell division protein [Lactobacillus helveticus]GFO98358.1 cell division protein [Lactobacillus helveticus]GFP01202.1 cell division protein [Lactobacillus helveticus]GFP03484.1 cell division protein [Lactobacillus helveticus]GFP04528.1 cell division protein [Lactobacillus helveticus]
MKLSHKLVLVSAAVLMGVSPVVGMANSASVQAAPIAHAKGVHNTYGKNSRVKMTKTMKCVDRYGKKTSMPALKGGHYTIWNVKNINGEVYYSIQTDLKYWIPAAATEGTVTYKSGNTTYTLRSNGKKVVTSTSTAKSTKKSAKKTTKKVVKKTAKKSESKKDSKKTTTKKSASKKTASSKKTTSKNTTSNTIKLIHNAYVYDENGKRIKKYEGKAKLTKGTEIDVYGTMTIKGKKYYQLDEEGTAFVKAGNIDKPTIITLKKNAYIYNGEGKTKKKLVKKGKTVKTTETRYIGTKLYYKIGDDQFVKAANVGKVKGTELDPVNEPDGAATVEVPDTEDVNSTKVTTKRVVSLYDIKGQKYADRIFDAGVSQQVSELRYIATSVNSTPQLFFKLASGRGYLKYDDVTMDGKILNPVNTPEQAKADVTVATAADKAKLTQSINEAASVKASEFYKLSSSSAKAAYDKAITDGAIVSNNASATIGQVNEAEGAIVAAKAKLNGAKIAVANFNSLTPDEVTAIVKAAANANNVPESAIQFSNNNTTLSIVTNGYTQPLNINDYAVQNSAINR